MTVCPHLPFLRPQFLLALGGLLVLSAPAPAAPKPVVTGFSPALAPAGALVQIAGSGFKGATFVSFNRIPARFTVNSDHAITAVVPARASGPIQVMAPGGMATSRAAFILGNPHAAITALSPTHGPKGALVQITGAGFLGATAVKFGGKPARFRVVSDTTVTAVVPAGAAGGPVSVVTPYGSAVGEAFAVR